MKAVLGLGSNLGDREINIASAIDMIEAMPETQILNLSNIYETAPFDVISEQQNYLNCCLLINTQLSPEQLLEACQAVENKLLRVRGEYHGARTMDVDILLYEGVSQSVEKLIIPHPEIKKRAFVMVPLSDIFHDCKALGLDFSEAYEEIDKEEVWLYK